MIKQSEGDPIESFRTKLRAGVAGCVEYLQRDLPCGTMDAFLIFRLLGYRPTRRRVDQAIARGEFVIASPTGRWRWDLDALTGFALILERLRAWLPTWHDAKKSPWELAADAEAPDADVLKEREVLEEMPLAKLVSLLVETADAGQEHLLEIGIDRRLPRGTPDHFFMLLGDIKRADSAEARRAIAQRFIALACEAGYLENRNG